MADGNDPPVRLIDLMLFAPVGLVALVQRELPQLIATGKVRVENRITLAKFVGRMAVRQTSNEFNRRMQNLEQARAAASAHPGAIMVTATELHTTGLAQLGISNYDTRAASDIVQQLASLSSADLDRVREYEQANRARRTILGKIAQLQAP